MSIIVTWTIPYSKEYQKGGLASVSVLSALICALLLLGAEGNAVGIVWPKRFMKSAKLLFPCGHNEEMKSTSVQSA